MKLATRWLVLLGSGMWSLGVLLVSAAEFPDREQLPVRAELPEPLRFLDGRPVETREQWHAQRRPELKALFEHYVYGQAPAAPTNVRGVLEREDLNALNGRGIKREIRITFGPEGTPPLNLLLLLPKDRPQPVGVFVGLNFCGNHAVLNDPTIPLPAGWIYSSCVGCEQNRATEAGRGSQAEVWCPDEILARGYALATCYNGDIDPDQPGFEDGVHPHFRKQGVDKHGPHEWGTIAAWAWGVQRIVDYLETVPELDARKIAVVGHSRLGKTALLAGAFDERIAIVIPHQSGTGGCAMSRANDQETVERITRVFPHWFCGEFAKFAKHEDQLPVDQNLLMALVAPRALLDTEGLQDTWANYDSATRGLHDADRVYKFLGAQGRIGTGQLTGPTPVTSENAGSLLQYRLDTKHELNRDYWRVILDFADVQYQRPATP